MQVQLQHVQEQTLSQQEEAQEQRRCLHEVQTSNHCLSDQCQDLGAQVDAMPKQAGVQKLAEAHHTAVKELHQLRGRHCGLQQQHDSLAAQVQLMQQTMASQAGQLAAADKVLLAAMFDAIVSLLWLLFAAASTGFACLNQDARLCGCLCARVSQQRPVPV